LNLLNQSLVSYQQALKLNPKHWKAMKGLAWTLYKKERYQKAYDWISKVYEHAPDDLDANLICARILLKTQQYQSGISILTRLETKIKGDQLAYVFSLQGEFFFALKSNVKAKSYFNKALSLRPFLVNALNGYGKCLLEEENHHMALDYFLRSSKVSPDNTETKALIAQAGKKVGDSS
jgi:tetratricopeptide (TPR) repeat protein